MSKSFIASVFLFSSAALYAQDASYFPMQTGSVWMYRQAKAGDVSEVPVRSVAVEGKETIDGHEYYKVQYFERTVWLRAGSGGAIVAYNRAKGAEEPWISLNAAEGATFPARLDMCTTAGRVVSRSAEIDTPAGRFTNAVQLAFQGNCADAGTTQQFWAAGVGLVSHEETSFAGPRRFDLVSYHPGPVGSPEVAFTMGLDAPYYTPGSIMTVRLTLRSTHPDPILLKFPSGQSFDLKIMDDSGKIVYTWSATRLFPMIYREEWFGPGARNYGFTVPLPALLNGIYKVRGYLTTDPVRYAAESSIEIAEVRINRIPQPGGRAPVTGPRRISK